MQIGVNPPLPNPPHSGAIVAISRQDSIFSGGSPFAGKGISTDLVILTFEAQSFQYWSPI